jgi:hypothetical protein
VEFWCGGDIISDTELPGAGEVAERKIAPQKSRKISNKKSRKILSKFTPQSDTAIFPSLTVIVYDNVLYHT